VLLLLILNVRIVNNVHMTLRQNPTFRWAVIWTGQLDDCVACDDSAETK
jgi:hypothetical protein